METGEIVKHREKKQLDKTPIDISETFELSENDFQKLSLIERYRAIWNRKYMDVFLLRYTHVPGITLYLYMSISGLIMLRNYVVPMTAEGLESVYWSKVLCCYLWYITTAHWICVLLYDSYWIPDEKDLVIMANKTLWDDYDQTLKILSPTRMFEESKEDSFSRKRMLNYVPDEETGLRWRFCIVCQRDAPPRAHHCAICNKCILKRDHHCYMTGRCVGFRNQRYFFFLCFFVSLSCIIIVIFEGRYLFNNDEENISNRWDTLFLPITLYKWAWVREISIHTLIMVSHLYLCPLIGSMCLAFVSLQSVMILKGLTSTEMKSGEKIKVNIGIVQRWQEVFGEWWILNFVMPSQILFRQPGDGEQWPGVINVDTLCSLRQLRVAS